MTMFSPPLDLADARILVVNDDGIRAPGLKVLESIAKSFTKDVWVFAPEEEKSGAGHSLSLSNAIRVTKLAPRRYAVDGSPTDCVMLAMGEYLKDKHPDLVLSGINRGGNLGDDVTYSGTVAGAMEATLLGIPAIALSQEVRGEKEQFKTTAAHACTRAGDCVSAKPRAGSGDAAGLATVAASTPSGPSGVRTRCRQSTGGCRTGRGCTCHPELPCAPWRHRRWGCGRSSGWG